MPPRPVVACLAATVFAVVAEYGYDPKLPPAGTASAAASTIPRPTSGAGVADLPPSEYNSALSGDRAQILMNAAPSTVAGHPMIVYNPSGAHVLVLYHGTTLGTTGNFGMARVQDYFPFAEALSTLGYCVLLPLDSRGDPMSQVFNSEDWGISVARDVRDHYTNGRPMAILGHSLGGGAAVAASKEVPGLGAYIAMHPATFANSGIIFDRANGPILFTTGTEDDGVFLGFTNPQRAKEGFAAAGVPKALINVIGNNHHDCWQPPTFGGVHFTAVTKWLECFLRKDATACEWLVMVMCDGRRDGHEPNHLRWCAVEGIPAVLPMTPAENELSSSLPPTGGNIPLSTTGPPPLYQ